MRRREWERQLGNDGALPREEEEAEEEPRQCRQSQVMPVTPRRIVFSFVQKMEPFQESKIQGVKMLLAPSCAAIGTKVEGDFKKEALKN